MTARIVAAVLGVVVLTIVGAFVTAVFVGRDRSPIPSGGDSALVTFEREAAQGRVEGTLTVQPSGMVTLHLRVTDTQARPVAIPPPAVLRMVDMAMGAEPLVLTSAGDGVFSGSARLGMAGRWELAIDLGAETMRVPFQRPD